jgi:hypothetical protein
MYKRKYQTEERKEKNSHTDIVGVKNDSAEYSKLYYRERMEKAGFKVKLYEKSGITVPSSDPQYFREWKKINEARKECKDTTE